MPYVQDKIIDMAIEPKAILLMDNCSAHPGEEELVSCDGKVTVKFLPPNVMKIKEHATILACAIRGVAPQHISNPTNGSKLRYVPQVQKIIWQDMKLLLFIIKCSSITCFFFIIISLITLEVLQWVLIYITNITFFFEK